MNILVQNSTNRVVHITDNTITLEADRAITPEVIFSKLGSDDATVYENVTPPTNDDGRYTYDGSVFTDLWPFKPLTKVQFIDHLQSVGGVSDTDLLNISTDPNLTSFWLKFTLAEDISVGEQRTIDGLDALVATGHLTPEGRQSVIDQWTRVRRVEP